MEVLKVFCVLSDYLTVDRIIKMQLTFVALYFICCAGYMGQFILHCAGIEDEQAMAALYLWRYGGETTWAFVCLIVFYSK
jgi:hypothetical protein